MKKKLKIFYLEKKRVEILYICMSTSFSDHADEKLIQKFWTFSTWPMSKARQRNIALKGVEVPLVPLVHHYTITAYGP